MNLICSYVALVHCGNLVVVDQVRVLKFRVGLLRHEFLLGEVLVRDVNGDDFVLGSVFVSSNVELCAIVAETKNNTSVMPCRWCY
jgi:hypothetical protein